MVLKKMVLNKYLLFIGILFMAFNMEAQKKTTSPAKTYTAQKVKIIKGIIEKGVEAGCIILRTKENKTYLLLNLKTEVHFGSCIKATGYIQNTVTVCMQGIPFYVISYCPCNKKTKPKYQPDRPKEKVQKSEN